MVCDHGWMKPNFGGKGGGFKVVTKRTCPQCALYEALDLLVEIKQEGQFFVSAIEFVAFGKFDGEEWEKKMNAVLKKHTRL